MCFAKETADNAALLSDARAVLAQAADDGSLQEALRASQAGAASLSGIGSDIWPLDKYNLPIKGNHTASTAL